MRSCRIVFCFLPSSIFLHISIFIVYFFFLRGLYVCLLLLPALSCAQTLIFRLYLSLFPRFDFFFVLIIVIFCFSSHPLFFPPRYETDRRADRDQINAMIVKNETDRKFDTNRVAHALTHFEHERVVDAQVCLLSDAPFMVTEKSTL